MEARRLTFVVAAVLAVCTVSSAFADADYDKALFYSKLRVHKSDSPYELPFVPTGYVPNENTILRVGFAVTNLGDPCYLFSAFGGFGGDSPMFAWYSGKNSPNFYYFDQTVATPAPSVAWNVWQGIDVELEVKDGNAKLVRSSDGEVLQVLSSGVDAGTSFSCDKGDGLYLFSKVGWWDKAGSAPDIRYGGQFYVYSLSVSEKDGNGGETLVHRYVPCKVDGVVGLADTVTKTVIFHRNEWAEGDSPLTVDEGDVILPETRVTIESSAVLYAGGTASFSSSFLIGGMVQEDATFVWDFGDGAAFVTTKVASISHVYEAAGTFTVSVTGGTGGLSAGKTLENCVTVASDPSPLAHKIGRYGKTVAFAVNDCEGTFEDFPVLVRLTEDSPQGFSYADFADSSTGAELRFMGDDGKLLAHEVDTWNPDGTSLVWVKLPICAKSKVFYALYGGTPKVMVNPADVWSAYIGVWHMGEAEGDCADATGHGLTARPVGATENSVGIAGPVGVARQSATTEAEGYLDVGSYGEIYSGPSRTMSGWVKMASNAYDQNIFAQKDYSTDSGWYFTVGWDGAGKDAFVVRGYSNRSGLFYSTAISDGGWAHVVLAFEPDAEDPDTTYCTATVNGEKLKDYKGNDAMQLYSGSCVTQGKHIPLAFGNQSNGEGMYGAVSFDELRLRRDAVTPAFAKAEYDSQTSLTFLSSAGAADLKVPGLSVIIR